MSEVVLYGRPGCHLCDEAREGLLAILGDGEVLREVDIEQDAALHARLLERIPVVEVAGEEVCELFLDAAAVRARLDRVASAGVSGRAGSIQGREDQPR